MFPAWLAIVATIRVSAAENKIFVAASCMQQQTVSVAAANVHFAVTTLLLQQQLQMVDVAVTKLPPPPVFSASTVCLFSPDVNPGGLVGSKHQLTN